MYARIIKIRNQRWSSVFQPSNQLIRLKCQGQAFSRSMSYATVVGGHSSHVTFFKRLLLDSVSSCRISTSSRYGSLHSGSHPYLKNRQLRVFSSQGDGRNTNEGRHSSVKETHFGSGKTQVGKGRVDARNCEAHARLAELDQKEWLQNQKLSIEHLKKESPFLTRREKFKNEILKRIVPWEKINVSWENFPYYINEHTKDILVECVASHLRNKNFTSKYGARLTSSNGRLLLRSNSGTELYRERIIRALAQDLQVPLLVLDRNVFAPYDFGNDYSTEYESDDNAESVEESASESEDEEDEDEHDANNEEEWSSNDARSDCSDDDEISVQENAEAALRKLIPREIEDFEERVSGESENSSDSSKSEDAEPSDASKRPLKKGDRVRYIGRSVVKANNRPLSSGQRGEVYEVEGDQVAVILDNDNEANGGESDEKLMDQSEHAPFTWINIKEIQHDPFVDSEDSYIALQALCEVLQSMQPIIVYFPDFLPWFRSVSKGNRKEFYYKVLEMFEQISGPTVLISGINKVEKGSETSEKFTMILPNFGRLAKLFEPFSLKRLTEGLKGSRRAKPSAIPRIFPNILTIHPPEEEDLLRTFNKQIEEDRRTVIARRNLNEIHKVLEENEMSCTDLLHLNVDGVILTKQKAEKIVGWARNHYLSSCHLPSIKGEILFLPRESLDIAIMRLRDQEPILHKSSLDVKAIAKDEYEKNFVSAVVPPGEIGVRFDDIGALEDVKKTLNELAILPMRRPELFSRGNLLRPCKGILLFGPPGTGKTLLAKALATEAGANFISITGSQLTSKWFGDAEKLTKALFSFASKLAPVIIFVDEVDSLLGARGGSFEHEATRRMRNEFMAAWDGLRSKDTQRILILGATNRPFDLDDAVIRRLPRRIYVDLPDAVNRMKILKIFLEQENLETDFQYKKLANETEGYSGSDLKNLCIAAAYRPVQELLEEENKSGKSGVGSTLRPLTLGDFIQSKAKVGPSVAFDAASMNELRKWNEQYGEGGSRGKSPFGF